MRKIRLEWEADGRTWEDFLVSKEITTEEINDVIKEALETGCDEVAEFVSRIEDRGYKIEMFRENIETFEF